MSNQEVQVSKEAPVMLAHTVKYACASLSICRSTLYGLIASGQIRSIKLLNRTLIPASELQRIVSVDAT